MDIEERLEKLAQRHEALTQTVELIAAMQRATHGGYEQCWPTGRDPRAAA
jgi:hypothetical protein